jgi:hypothetical protein
MLILKNYIVHSSFLFNFIEAIKLLSGSYYATTHHVLHILAKVAYIFSNYNEHPQYDSFMKSIFEKYKKYYEDISILYCMTLCLDLREKTYVFYNLIEYLYEILDFDENYSTQAT